MKYRLLATVAALLAVAPAVQAGPARDQGQGQRPCFSVNVQNERNNEARVEQDCNRNYSRTVQAGRTNRAETVQSGEVNDNKVRQYQYEPLR